MSTLSRSFELRMMRPYLALSLQLTRSKMRSTRVMKYCVKRQIWCPVSLSLFNYFRHNFHSTFEACCFFLYSHFVYVNNCKKVYISQHKTHPHVNNVHHQHARQLCNHRSIDLILKQQHMYLLHPTMHPSLPSSFIARIHHPSSLLLTPSQL